MRFFAFALLLLVSVQSVAAQTKAPTATISGRVLDGNKGVAGIPVSIISQINSPRPKMTSKSVTDGDGYYHLTNVQAGRQNVTLNAPTYVIESRNMYGQPGKSVTVSPGENIENINFAVKRGAVITGMVKDSGEQPVMGQAVQITRIDNQGQKVQSNNWYYNWSMMMTDDRGIYRIYGLAAGRYKVSVGASKEDVGVGYSLQGRGYFLRTYYPGVTDENEAKIVEVAEGGEATNIDITVGRRENTFGASGRVVDAETGKPLPNVVFGYGVMREDDKGMGSYSFGPTSDEAGEFRIDGLVPNQYGVFAQPDDRSEFYSDPVKFKVVDADVSDVEIKVHRGSTISGTITLENNNDPGLMSKLAQTEVYGFVESPNSIMYGMPNRGKVAADGTFRVGGLRPGKIRLNLSSRNGKQNFSLMRTERDGVEQREGITIAAGENLSGVRLVLSYGTGKINGVVKIEGGTLPESTNMYVNLIKVGATGPANLPGSDVDSRGRFLLENVPSGDYEVMLNIMQQPGPDAQPPKQLGPVKKSVSVSDGGQVDVTLTVDLNASAQEKTLQ